MYRVRPVSKPKSVAPIPSNKHSRRYVAAVAAVTSTATPPRPEAAAGVMRAVFVTPAAVFAGPAAHVSVVLIKIYPLTAVGKYSAPVAALVRISESHAGPACATPGATPRVKKSILLIRILSTLS